MTNKYIIKFEYNQYYTGRTVGKFSIYSENAITTDIYDAMLFDSKEEVINFCIKTLKNEQYIEIIKIYINK